MTKQQAKQIIQVCYDTADEKTLKREKKGLTTCPARTRFVKLDRM